jgi:hypothetical protein
MKKQLLIAAVAATMGTAAIADISITGGSKINYTNTDSSTEASDTNIFKHDIDFTLKGVSGDTTASMTVSNAITTETTTPTGTLTVEDVYVASKIGDVNVKIGQFASSSDSNISDGPSRKGGRFQADTTIAGVTVKFVDQNASGQAIIVSGEVNGVALSHKMADHGAGANGNTSSTDDYTDSSISGTFGGVTAMYRIKDFDGTTGDLSTWQVSTDVNDLHLFAASAKSDSTGTTFDSEGVFGAMSGLNRYVGAGVKTTIAGNTVTVAFVDKDATSTGAEDSLTKIVVTRPLASGATFEAVYTDEDMAGAATTKKLDLELAVKF